MLNQPITKEIKLFLFCLFVCLLTYGFALTNYSLTVDSESPVFPDISMGLGRWGTNLIRYRLFGDLWPYITLMIGLFFLSLTAIQLSKIFRFDGIASLLFCALFLTLPQHAYQLAFTMQADAIPIGFFTGICGLNLFLGNTGDFSKPSTAVRLFFCVVLMVFTIAVYQALVFVPVICYLICFFRTTTREGFNLKVALKQAALFAVLMVLSAVLYYISIKIFCPPIESGYLASYTSGRSSNRFVDFYNLMVDNLRGNFYYGDATYVFATLAFLVVTINCIVQKRFLVWQLLSLFGLLVLPFSISFFITNGANPPRLYVSSPIVFAFLIVFAFGYLKPVFLKPVLLFCTILTLSNIYFVTRLFYSSNQIFNHDLVIARKIENTIEENCPDFNANTGYVYFYGQLPESNYSRFKLENSDVFGGSLFRWDGGNNWRILNFFRVTDVAYYKFLDSKDAFDRIKDSIDPMPVWPNRKSVKQIENVVIVKIGKERGAPLPFE